MSESSMVSLVSETSFLIILRLLLFFACRKYLLRNLYHDLQDLSAERTMGLGMPLGTEDPSVELQNLPAPSTANRSNAAVSTKRLSHSTLSRGLFSLCFSESCILFLLLMLQAMEMLLARTRLLNWNISLSLLLTAILVLIPLSYSLVLSDSSPAVGTEVLQRPSSIRLLLNIAPVGLFLFLLSFIPLPSALPSSNIIVTALSRLTVLGTIILGALSGFGAINTAWAFFPVFFTTQSYPTGDDVLAAERGLQRVQNDLAQRRVEIQKLQMVQEPNTDSRWFSRVILNFGVDNPLSSAKQELHGLESLEYQMSRNLEGLKRRQAEAQFSKTFAGRVFNGGGRLFAIYCVYRIISSILNLLFPTSTHSVPSSPDERLNYSTGADAISTGLACLFALLPIVEVGKKDIAVISRQINLGLVGVIILSSIRLVLRGVARALRVTSRNIGASLMLLILAQLMGIYLLSTLVQLRTSFPPPPTRPDMDVDVGIVNLFSTLPEYQLFGSLFDGSFLLAAGLSVAVRWFGDKINGIGETTS